MLKYSPCTVDVYDQPEVVPAPEADGDADERAAALRAADPPVMARVADGACVLDCRTLGDDEAERIG